MPSPLSSPPLSSLPHVASPLSHTLPSPLSHTPRRISPLLSSLPSSIPQVLKKEISKTTGEEADKGGEYRAMLITAIPCPFFISFEWCSYQS